MNRIDLTFCTLAALALVSCSEAETAVMLTGLEFSPDKIEIVKGDSRQLDLVFTPETIGDKTVVWDSSNDAVVTVDDNGMATGADVGKAVVTAISSGLMATCEINVIAAAPEGLSLDTDHIELRTTESYRLNVTAIPEGTALPSLVWESSDQGVAVVDQSGNVMAVAPGTAVVRVSALSGEISDECEVTVRAKVNSGDYFYSDGTWSSELDASREVVGIVFWSGDPTAEDPALKADYPGCVNGLAVALTESFSKFQSASSSFYTSGYVTIQDWAEENMPGYESLVSGLASGDNGNFILGYNNTKVLRAFNGDADNADWSMESIGLLEEFIDAEPLPETTSGWYMPSIKELVLMCDGESDYNIFWGTRTFANRDIVNQALSEIDGTQLLGEGEDKRYWSSTEQDFNSYESKNFMLDFKIELAPSGMFRNSALSNRFVFAF